MNIKMKIITVANKILSKKSNEIVFYGRSKFESNHHALIQYMIRNGYNEKYKIYLVVSNENDLKHYNNINNVYPVPGMFSGAWHTLTAKTVFHCYGMGKMRCKVPDKQTVFDIWHGTALKSLGKYDESYCKSSTYILAASDFAKEYFKECFGYKENQFYIGGYPRCDLLFEDIDVLSKFGIVKNSYSKIVLYMPTFRKAAQFGYDDSDREFPLFTKDLLVGFNKYLDLKKIMFIIKPHPAQDNIPLLNELSLSNIKVIKNNELLNKKILLYSLVSGADILLTDYSSIYFDFLLTQKPIGFVIDDINEYSGHRGFVVDNPLDYMPGEKIQNVEELKSFIDGILVGKDDWKEERKRINDLVNADQSGGFCKKILDFVGIVK